MLTTASMRRRDTFAPGGALSDSYLVSKIAQRDPVAMRLLFSRHRGFVFKFVRRMVHDDMTAEELVSDVFLAVWRGAGYDGQAKVTTWLMGIARFKCASERRRRKELAWDQRQAESIIGETDDPEAALQDKETDEILGRCLAKLSPEHGQVIKLIYYEDKSMDEVSKIVGISVPTVKTRVFYARKKLAAMVTGKMVKQQHAGAMTL